MHRTLLALDLGTKTGFCVGACDQGSDHQISDVWDLREARSSGAGMRFINFRSQLNKIHAAYPIGQVAFEEVRRHLGTDAAHFYGGLRGILMEWCEEHSIPYEGVSVQEIKKHWTGKGNASKEMMIAECHRREIPVKDDNEADAIALFDLVASRP
ncbi:crossover junction endodeoxyribonuclease RuvC [Methyloceanibacter caenitepidi]|uniref:Putative bacteriophage-related protein n=1 Tax=Methyloceanibacter caenitepidi TaxID=1384459 RepID=A0A0A8K254_9HYPH|nr:hypothetical protein [Methyloceanibacter caenitepidi]BAQ16079.1 putative bacteriophage-related protein [Methyloceanibacter caenitepidi]